MKSGAAHRFELVKLNQTGIVQYRKPVPNLPAGVLLAQQVSRPDLSGRDRVAYLRCTKSGCSTLLVFKNGMTVSTSSEQVGFQKRLETAQQELFARAA